MTQDRFWIVITLLFLQLELVKPDGFINQQTFPFGASFGQGNLTEDLAAVHGIDSKEPMVLTDTDRNHVVFLINAMISIQILGFDLRRLTVLAYDLSTAELLRGAGLNVLFDPFWAAIADSIYPRVLGTGLGRQMMLRERFRAQLAFQNISYFWFDSDMCFRSLDLPFFSVPSDLVVSFSIGYLDGGWSNPIVASRPWIKDETSFLHACLNNGVIAARMIPPVRKFLLDLYASSVVFIGIPGNSQVIFNKSLFEAGLRLNWTSDSEIFSAGHVTGDALGFSVMGIGPPSVCEGCEEPFLLDCRAYHPTCSKKKGRGLNRKEIKIDVLRDGSCWYVPADLQGLIEKVQSPEELRIMLDALGLFI